MWDRCETETSKQLADLTNKLSVSVSQRGKEQKTWNTAEKEKTQASQAGYSPINLWAC